MDASASKRPSSPSSSGAGCTKGYLYDAEGHDRDVGIDPQMLEQLHERALLWIDVQGRCEDDIRRVAAILSLDRASVADLLKPRPTPRLDNYGAYVQFSLFVSPDAAKSGSASNETADTEAHARPERSPLDFVVGHNWVLTVHDDDLQFLHAFRAQDKAETEIGALSAAALTASLLDWHLESFFAEVARIELVVDRLDERVLAEPSSEGLLARILAIRRRIARLRRLLVAQRSVFYGLNRPDLTQMAGSGGAAHFETLISRFERAVDEVEHTRDLIVGSFELFTSRSAQQTNELVKALTFFTVIIGCTAAVAGLFGMNFDPPFFKSGSVGFFAVTFGLFVLAITAWVVGRRRRWI
jgi:magnesium transporter